MECNHLHSLCFSVFHYCELHCSVYHSLYLQQIDSTVLFRTTDSTWVSKHVQVHEESEGKEQHQFGRMSSRGSLKKSGRIPIPLVGAAPQVVATGIFLSAPQGSADPTLLHISTVESTIIACSLCMQHIKHGKSFWYHMHKERYNCSPQSIIEKHMNDTGQQPKAPQFSLPCLSLFTSSTTAQKISIKQGI